MSICSRGQRNELALLGTRFAVMGHDFSRAISFGTFAIKDLGETKHVSTERKIREMIDEALRELDSSGVQ